MERSNKNRNRRDHKAKKSPKVPIKTYRWEDIRRARRRGGYPWTHLYKGPFTETVDPDQFTMDALRRAKSSSPMGRRSDRVDISEVSSWADYSGKTTPTLLHELISEPHEDISTKNSRPGSVVIEEYLEYDDKDTEDDVQVKEFQMESAESSDNVSQYLDKEDRGPATSKTKEAAKRLLDESKEFIHEETEALEEDTRQKKRKLSADSSHSRYSLSKLGVIKKLQDAKNKIKVPKISFATKKIGRKRASPPKDEKPKKDPKKKEESSRPRKLDKPVYIHIPLKPPSGETDEFSHLEFETKQENGKIEKSIVNESGEREDQVVESKTTDEAKTELEFDKKSESEEVEEGNNNSEVKEERLNKSPFSTLERGPRVTKKPPLKINPAFKKLLKDVRQLKDKDSTEAQEDNSTEEKDKDKDFNSKPAVTAETPKIEHSEMNIRNETHDEVPLDLEEQQTSDSESPKEDVFDKLFQASFSKKDTEQKSAESDNSRDVRSKSAEPQNKRRSSMDSSYSRKSLSKLAIMRKLKEASEKIKGAFSLDNLRKKVSKKEEHEQQKTEEEEKHKPKKPKLTSVVKIGHLDKPKHVEPVYIHIPLKPPEGQTDEFSHLANDSETVNLPETMKEERTDSLDSTSPVSPKNDDIHFIFLTPPSDDEILDEKEPDIPETPSSSDDMVFFGSLKKLAQDVVDQVSPDTNKNPLETVREESVSDKGSTNGIEVDVNKDTTETTQEQAEITDLEEKMIVDVEDGLNETPNKTTEEHLKSAFKTTESTSPKRVSFKRKSKSPKVENKENDNGYETIEAPKEEQTNILEGKCDDVQKTDTEEKLNKENDSAIEESRLSQEFHDKKGILAGETSQSMSVDEEKTYLDQKIVKDASLEEDYNKWSNETGDHEYEPINAPDEVTVRTTSILPHVTVVDEDSDPKIVISATDILDKPPEEKKKPFFQFGRFHRDKTQGNREKNQDHDSSSDTQSRSSQGKDLPEIDEQPKTREGPNKFQAAFKQRAEQLKTKTNELCNKLHNIKKPNIHMPKSPEFKKPQFKKPDFKRFKIEKPKINLHFPKIPDTATIHLPHISLPGSRKTTETVTTEIRQLSTESNADDSEQQTKRHKFDLSFGGTFPRFRKTKKTEQEVAFATVPRTKKGNVTVSSESSNIRVPLHSEDSTDASERQEFKEETEPRRIGYEDRETVIDIGRVSGHRFPGEVIIDDEYERENQAINRADYLSRWQHGNFRERNEDDDDEDERIVGQLVEQRFGRSGERYSDYEEQDVTETETLEDRLRRDEDRPRYIEDEDEEEFDIRLIQNKHMVTDLDNLEDDQTGQIRDGYSSEGSGSLHKKGRLGKLDIDSDEFFVVHEIREGFQTPANALAQMNEYDPIGSNRSLPMQMREPEGPQPPRTERKPIKKPKRKKTPHVSQEEIPGDEESIERAVTPSRPKRRSKRNKKKSDIVPYQESIPPLETGAPHGQRLDFPRESLGILGDDERDEQEFDLYEHERLQGKAQPDRFKPFQVTEKEREEPNVPPRKHRSLKSLTQSENESILTDNRFEDERILDAAILEDQIIQSHQIQAAPPRRPNRRSRSHTSSLSRVSLPPSQRDTDSVFTDEGYLADNQQIPSYLIENQNYKQQYQATQEIPSDPREEELRRQPCVEEPCAQELRDYMGYAIVDKSKPPREPPLPPPRTPPRRRKREIEPEQKFATVPRNVGLSQSQAPPPVRPLRNYSTLSHVKSSRKDRSPYENDNENKENEMEIAQYIEIEDEINRDLVSGEVVQKMRQRPLPAPPRPPRKPKTTRKSLQDITFKENIISSTSDPKAVLFQEETVSTQTEPLPPDFICEEIRQEPTDTIITPRVGEIQQSVHQIHKIESSESDSQKSKIPDSSIQRFEIYDPRTRPEHILEQSTRKAEVEDRPQVRRELITPSVYSFEETVTHGTLLVQPLDGAKVVPDHQLSRERLVTISKDEDDEISEVPESFKRLRSPEDGRSERGEETEEPAKEVLRAEKLQVSDLDVNRLTVNQLLASKIVVSEIDSSAVSTDEIQGRSGGAVKLGEVELPPHLLEELVRQLQTRLTAGEQAIANDSLDSQKKTPIDPQITSELVQEPTNPEIDSTAPLVRQYLSSTQDRQQSNTFPEFPTDAVQIQNLSESPQDHSKASEDQLRKESSLDSSSELQHDLSPEPPVPPPRGCTLEDGPPRAPRRKSRPTIEDPEPVHLGPPSMEMLEPDVDDQPPPRPPQPLEGLYLPSQPPPSFYALRAKQFVDENIPTAPRRKRHQSGRSRPVSRSHSTSDDSSIGPHRPSRIARRFSEPSIPELSGRLIQACGSRINNALKRLIYHLTDNILRNADGKQDLHVFMIILLVLIAGLILLGYGEDRTVIHLHHWEYFNPPKDL